MHDKDWCNISFRKVKTCCKSGLPHPEILHSGTTCFWSCSYKKGKYWILQCSHPLNSSVPCPVLGRLYRRTKRPGHCPLTCFQHSLEYLFHQCKSLNDHLLVMPSPDPEFYSEGRTHRISPSLVSEVCYSTQTLSLHVHQLLSL